MHDAVKPRRLTTLPEAPRNSGEGPPAEADEPSPCSPPSYFVVEWMVTFPPPRTSWLPVVPAWWNSEPFGAYTLIA